MRSGSAVAMQAKLDAAVAFAQRSQDALESARFSPQDYPVLIAPRQAVAPKRNHSQRRVSSGGGSATMNQVLEQKEAAITEDETKAQGVASRKEAAAGKKAEVEEATQELQDAWARCGVACMCGAEWPVVCLVVGMKRCATCNDVKLRVCVKRQYVAARRPLMLMPPPDLLTLPAPPEAQATQQQLPAEPEQAV
jgi:hypothetical protein